MKGALDVSLPWANCKTKYSVTYMKIASAVLNGPWLQYIPVSAKYKLMGAHLGAS